MSDITISNVFKNAWRTLPESKGPIWAIAVVTLLILLTIAYLSNLIVTQSPIAHYWLSYIVFPIMLYLLVGPFYGGAFMVAVKRFRQEAVDIKTGYSYLPRYLPAAITMGVIGMLSNLMSIIVNIPTIGQSLGRGLPYFDLLGGLFSLFVYAFLLLSVPLVIDKNVRIGDALRESFHKIKPHWLSVFLIFLLAYLILFVLYIPAILGLVIHSGLLTLLGGVFFIVVLIWFLPFLFLLGADIYHRLVDGHDIALSN